MEVLKQSYLQKKALKNCFSYLFLLLMRSPLLSLPNIWVIAVTQWYRFNKTHSHMALSRGLPHVDPFYFEILPMWEIFCASDMFVIILIASIHSYAFFHQPWVSLPILCLIVYQVLWEVCWRSERCKWQVIFTPWCVPTQLQQCIPILTKLLNWMSAWIPPSAHAKNCY